MMNAFPSSSGSPVLSLADLAAFDARATGIALGQGGELRVLCPLCGQSKPKDASHRSLSLNTATGVWHCHRCGQGGKVRESWDERPLLPRRERARTALKAAFALDPAPDMVSLPQGPQNASKSPSPDAAGWRVHLRGLQLLPETRGMAYLHGRALTAETAHASGVRFSSAFLGRPAIVFPLRDHKGALVGAQGRYSDGKDSPKARTLGDKRSGLFATAGALTVELPALIVTEAPLDALSLAEAGYPAVAVCGTEPPAWFHRACAFRRVLLAFDADEAGDKAADKLAPLLESFGAKCERLRPDRAPSGWGKDWNEMLQASGRDVLSDWLASRVL